MRRIKTKGKWLIDLMLWQRDSNRLHLFSLVLLRGPRYFLKTPDICLPMPTKPIKLPLPKALKEAQKILKSKQ